MSKKKGAAAPRAKSQKQWELIERAKLAARQPGRFQSEGAGAESEKSGGALPDETPRPEGEALKDGGAVPPEAEISAADGGKSAAEGESLPAPAEPSPEKEPPLSAPVAETVQGASAEENSENDGVFREECPQKPSVDFSAPEETETSRSAGEEPPSQSKRNGQKKEFQRRNSPMAGRAIVVTSGKGGVGKTTTTANLSMALAKLGKKVVVVDGDTGLRSLDLIMGLENRIVYNLVDVIEGACDLKKALIRDKRVDGLYLLPTAQTREKDCVNEAQMKQLSDELRKDFDFVIFDCPAGIEAGFRNASAGADEALVVTTPDVSPVRDADRIIGMLESQGKEQIHLIINRMRPKMMRSGDMLGVDDVLDILSVSLIGVVPEDDAVVKSSNKGEPLTLDPDCPAATAFMNIARRITGEEVPFLDIEHMGGGFLAKLSALFGRK